MQNYFTRTSEAFVKQNLRVVPAVAILGSRQVGKSTMVKNIASDFDAFVYLDLQNYTDLQKISDPFLFVEANAHATICIDEIQLAPHLFSVLRSIIDVDRKNGKFILLGSASRKIIQQTSESLAGRIGLIELSPFTVNELSDIYDFSIQKYWIRGGYPLSYLSENDSDSFLWRQNFIRTYIERDIPQLGFQIPAIHIRRLLQMCSHLQGQVLNQSKLAQSLDITHPTLKRHIDILEQTYILRTIPPYEKNVKKRIIKSPKVYVRDSGLLHSLLSIETFTELLGNPIFGSSWEGLVLENIITSMFRWNYYFYRTSTGDEVDLVLESGDTIVAFECKASTNPQVSKGFWNAIQDIKPTEAFIIAPINDSYKIKENVTVCGISQFFKEHRIRFK